MHFLCTMKKCYVFVLMLVMTTTSRAFIPDVDSGVNVMSVKVMPTADLTKVPVRVSLTNSLAFTFVQCFLATPDSVDTFFYLDDADSNASAQDSTKRNNSKSVAYTPTERWAGSHMPILAWNTKSCPDAMMILIVSPKNEIFAGNDGPLITLYFNATALADGDYSVRMTGANMAWIDNKNIKAVYSPDTMARFAIRGGKLITTD